MNYVYSSSTNSMYPLDLKEDYLNAGSWPEDGIEISEEDYREYNSTPPNGMMLGSVNGLPCWIEIPPPTHEEEIAVAEAQKQVLIDQTNDFINSKQWPGKAAIGRLKSDELEQYNLWLDYLDDLEAVDTSTAPSILWPSEPTR